MLNMSRPFGILCATIRGMRNMMTMYLELMTSIATKQKLNSVNRLLFMRPKHNYFPNSINKFGFEIC